jgi:hypothetical protein
MGYCPQVPVVAPALNIGDFDFEQERPRPDPQLYFHTCTWWCENITANPCANSKTVTYSLRICFSRVRLKLRVRVRVPVLETNILKSLMLKKIKTTCSKMSLKRHAPQITCHVHNILLFSVRLVFFLFFFFISSRHRSDLLFCLFTNEELNKGN